MYHMRVSRLLAMERVRSRLARDLHDDLGARLSRISILSEVAARRVSSDAPSAQRLLGEVGETAQSLLQAAADITWSVDPRQDTLGSLAARIRRFASDMLDGRDMSWSLETVDEDAAITLPPEYRRHVLLVFQEAVNNVVRHSGARRVTLRLLAANDRLVASIEDDGCGFDTGGGAGPASPGNGLINMARRAEQLGGTLSTRSSAGMGAIVELSVPLP